METQEKESSTAPPSLEAAAARACPVLPAQVALLEASSFKLSFRVAEQPGLTLPHAGTLSVTSVSRLYLSCILVFSFTITRAFLSTSTQVIHPVF